MSANNLFQNRETYSKYYGNFRGVDFSSDHTNVSERRLAYAVNMYKDYFSGQATGIETIPGFRKMLNLKSKIYGIHYYKHKDSASNIVEKVLIHAGKKLYLWSGYPDGTGKSEFNSVEMNERKSTSFVFNNRLYIIDGKNYLVYDGENIKSVIDEAYVPTTRINIIPGDSQESDVGDAVKYPIANKENGVEVYQRNLLSDYATNTFVANGKPTRYYLAETDIESVQVRSYGKEVPEEEELEDVYYVNKERGYVEFFYLGVGAKYFTKPEETKADDKGGFYPEGYAGIEITYKKKIERVSGVSETVKDSKDLILGCTIATVFDGRVFLSGNPLCPNHIFWCGANDTGYIDPSYFGILDYQQDGHGIAPITAMMPVSDSLLVLKDDSQEDGCVYFHTPMETQKDIQPVVYPSTQGLNGVGCLGACVNFLDDPVFMSRLGVKAIGQLSVRLERAMEHRSSMVDSLLLDYDLKNACFAEWGGYLFVLVGGGHIFLADSRQRFTNELGNAEYEWYYLENIGTYSSQRQPYIYSAHIDEIFKDRAIEMDGKSYYLEVADKVRNFDLGTVGSLVGKIVDSDLVKTIQVTDGNGNTYTRHYIVYEGISEGGSNERHLYVVENAEYYVGDDEDFKPATLLQTLGDTLYFGTDSGDICAFNFDKRDKNTGFIPPEYYTFDGRIIVSGCATKMDNCGIPHLTKSTTKKSTVIKLQAFDSTAAKLKVRTNREPFKQVARINSTRTGFDDMEFDDIPIQTESKGLFSIKEKEKKWVEKQYYIYSDEFKKPFALFYAAYRYYVAGRYKE